jgi:hypothetical protein
MTSVRDALLSLFFRYVERRAHRYPRCPDVLSAVRPLREVRLHHTLQHADTSRSETHMDEKNEKHREAERHVTEELANQAKQEPGSAAEAESKERRAQAERELQDAK